MMQMRLFIIIILTVCVSCSRNYCSIPRGKALTGRTFYTDLSYGNERYNRYISFTGDSTFNLVFFYPDGKERCTPRRFETVNPRVMVYRNPEFTRIFRDADTLYYYSDLGLISSRYMTYIDSVVDNEINGVVDYEKYVPILYPDQLDSIDVTKNTPELDIFKNNWLLESIIQGKAPEIDLKYRFRDSPHRDITLSIYGDTLRAECVSDLFEPITEVYKIVKIWSAIKIIRLIQSDRDTSHTCEAVKPFLSNRRLTRCNALPMLDGQMLHIGTVNELYDVLLLNEFVFNRAKGDDFETAVKTMRPIATGYEYYINSRLMDTIPNTQELKRLYPDYNGSSEILQFVRRQLRRPLKNCSDKAVSDSQITKR